MKEKIKKVMKYGLQFLVIVVVGILVIKIFIFMLKISFFLFKIELVLAGIATIGYGVKVVVEQIKSVVNIKKRMKALIRKIPKSEKFDKERDYATNRIETTSLIKDNNGNEVYVEEWVPIDLEELKKKETEKSHEALIISYEDIKHKIETMQYDYEELEKKKMELIKLSFTLQDIATKNNLFCGVYTKELLKNKKEIYKGIKTYNQNKPEEVVLKRTR